jgi:uncharacterized protein
MLRFDLAEIVRTPGRRQVYKINEPPYVDEDVEFISPVTGEVTVTNTGTMLLVRGPIHTTIELECSRCLEPVRTPIDVDLEEEFDLKIVEDATHHDQQVEVVEDEIGRVFEGKVMDLAVLIRQAALLAAPLQPLCREDCAGIAIRSSTGEQEGDRQRSPFSDLSKLLEE